jgi:polyferredoxin
MTRTVIIYDGIDYVVGRSAESVKDEIAAILASGKPGWMRVNHGQGRLQVADLLIRDGVGVSVLETTDPDDHDPAQNL